ncbi:dual specificity protein phosphatase family protein [Sorangium sp. So ce260]|uniref:protein-tyrosine phosphatase family protein n=1 Tax=Sorangium sp. So ce260 TaxID=3133291 RepID=UPI003F602158
MRVRLRPALVFLLIAPYAVVFYAFLALRRATASFRPRHPWRTWVSPNLLIGGFLLPGDVVELRRLGVRAVINVSRELYDPVLALRAAGVDYLRVPCWDMCAPTIEEAARGVAFLERYLGAGHRVHVHCASGVGRSVTLALCYLATRGGLEVGEAIALLERQRPRVALSRGQREFVERYVAWDRAQAEPRERAAPPAITACGGGTSG